MSLRRIVLLACTAALLIAAPSAGAAALIPLTSDSGNWGSRPIHISSPFNDPRAFVVERGGAVRVVRDGVLLPTPFLTVPGVTSTSGTEFGMQSIAFAPDYATSRLFYVFASFTGPDRVEVREYRAPSADADVADPSPLRTLKTWNLTATNHLGGQLAFGPDLKLYVTLGDNGDGSRAQDWSSNFGKVLVFDTSQPGPLEPSVFAGGLRNPYRASFDLDGRLWIGDVGDGEVEEIDVGVQGANYGWPYCEGTIARVPNGCQNNAAPYFTYLHSDDPGGCAVIGGVQVTDTAIAGLTNRYLFGDLCRPKLYTLGMATAGPQTETGLEVPGGLYSFGTNGRLCNYVAAGATAYRLAADASAGAACPLPPRTTASPKPTVQILNRSLRVDRKGYVRVKFRCDGFGMCSGNAYLRTASKVRLKRGTKARAQVLADSVYLPVSPGTTRTVKLLIRPRVRKYLRSRPRTKIFIRVFSTNQVVEQPISRRVWLYRARR